jgi:preprotein translocase SecE subunit
MANEVEKKAAAAKPAKKSKLNIKQYLKEMMGEVKKLTWLSFGDLVKHTAMVFVFVLAMSAVIWLLDLGFSAGVKGLATLTGAGSSASTSQTAE